MTGLGKVMKKTVARIAPSVFIVLIAIFGLGIAECKQSTSDDTNPGQPGDSPYGTEIPSQPGPEGPPETGTETRNSAELSVHFLELGNQFFYSF